MLVTAKTRKGGQVRFTGEQVNLLELMFSQSKYITSDRRRDISSEVSLTEKQIKTWFQNRRAKLKKTILPREKKSTGGKINHLSPLLEYSQRQKQQQMDNQSIPLRHCFSTNNSDIENDGLVNEDTSSSSSASTASIFPFSSHNWSNMNCYVVRCECFLSNHRHFSTATIKLSSHCRATLRVFFLINIWCSRHTMFLGPLFRGLSCTSFTLSHLFFQPLFCLVAVFLILVCLSSFATTAS